MPPQTIAFMQRLSPQTRGGNCSYEEESGTTVASQERQDRQRGRHTNAAQQANQARHDETVRPLRPNGTHEYVSRLFPSRGEAKGFLRFFFTETNRKCPKWAEFNPPPTSGIAGPSTGTPALPGLGFNRGPQPSFGFAAVPSPLATSPPVVAMQDNEGNSAITQSGSGTKIKLSLNKLKKT